MTAIGISMIITGWLICGILAYSLSVAYYMRRFKTIRGTRQDREDRRFCLAMALFGPIALAVFILCLIKFNGWRDAFQYGLKL